MAVTLEMDEQRLVLENANNESELPETTRATSASSQSTARSVSLQMTAIGSTQMTNYSGPSAGDLPRLHVPRVFHAVKSDDRPPIFPWKLAREEIVDIYAKKHHHTLVLETSIAHKHKHHDSLSPSKGDPPPTPAAEASHGLPQVPLTVSMGFHRVRSIYVPTPGLRHVAYNNINDTFLTNDNRVVNLWKGSLRIRKVEETIGYSQVLWVSKYRLWVMAASDLQLKVFDHNFEPFASFSMEKPILRC